MLLNFVLRLYFLHVCIYAFNIFKCGGPLPNGTVEQIEQDYIAPLTDAPESYSHIRIQTFDATSVILDHEFLNAVKETVDFYQRLLSVHPVTRLKVSLKYEWGPDWVLCKPDSRSSYWLRYSKLQPPAQNRLNQTGNQLYVVGGADLAIFVTHEESLCPKGVIAWASPCVNDSNGRMVSGQINKCPAFDAPGMTRAKRMNTLKHELMHVIGVNPLYFKYPSVGKWSNTSDWKVTNKHTEKKQKMLVATKYPKTQAALREHFGCQNMEGIELENAGRPGTVGAHWEKLIFGNELMVGSIEEQMPFSKITAMYLTELRRFHLDPPFYQLDLGVIQSDINNYWYGRSLGCTFAQKSCREYVDEAGKRNHLETPAFPYCTPENAMFAPYPVHAGPTTESDYLLPVCCGSKQVKTRCLVAKFDLHSIPLKDTHGRRISTQQFIRKYGYLEDTQAHGYYGLVPLYDYCPMIDLDVLAHCSGGFESCKGDQLKPPSPDPKKNSPSKNCFLGPVEMSILVSFVCVR